MTQIKTINKDYDLICVGGGIMSATLALLTKLVDPSLSVLIFETRDAVALESSGAWNNAGTGHSALCELNYTPLKDDGSVDITKALDICNQFELSKQFWSFLVEESLLDDPGSFISAIPHHSWVTGKDNVDYLEKRFKALTSHFMFKEMKFSTVKDQLSEWIPLMMHERSENEPFAATRMERGTELNYEVLTKTLFKILEEKYDTEVRLNHEVLDIDPAETVEWSLKVNDLKADQLEHYESKHVFIGAGGATLLLLQKVEIEEKNGYGGFPVSGEWLVCRNEDVICEHNAKVYSKAGIGDPPMSVPHLDTRYINGKRELLFGPFAGFSPKFLKEGSYFDLLKSVKFGNIHSLLGAFWHNLPLTKYLLHQLQMSHKDRMDLLRTFVLDAKDEDWELIHAGQRVQIIKKDEFEGGVLRFGTEVLSSHCGRITALLGASPGASTAVKIMLDVLEKAFPEEVNSNEGKERLSKIVPNWKEPFTADTFEKNLEASKKSLNL